MINLDFSLAISLYAVIFLSAILAVWLFGRRYKDKEALLDSKFIWFCAVCTYTYVNTKDEIISTCPRCGSYNKK